MRCMHYDHPLASVSNLAIFPIEYFHELEEESIKDNFVLIYELLDELMDFGYPQTTETKILKEFITQESHKLVIAPRPPPAVTNAVSWRMEGINGMFLSNINNKRYRCIS